MTGPGLGTRLRHLIELLDGDVAIVEEELGLTGFRPRYAPFLRTLATLGPSTIRDLAKAVEVTHSAASQTITQMDRQGLVSLSPGTDARQRIVDLTPRTRALLPKLEQAWQAAEAAGRELDAELPYPLSEVVIAATEALRRKPLRDRIRHNL
ncbi:MarR family winged helix-turn-helix transcriptional regulator [Kutzneria kofuensis]|uniref:DNA-binding MarR family transcriptional regulator n=1 Tax=Kutzneria kofuensis TaxID=103725 RepID=A0A7W9NIM8_9PSEU|nr:MarR family transcriptional regulator [Kutzneria kofuensis]MBB5893739.1 DNA-binding MarR family transcriptional regulator [Kutzneria kofuensis]